MCTMTRSTFRNDEDGAATVLSLFIFLMIIMVCGVGIDLMRHDNLRIRVQNVSDAAALSAARVNGTFDSESLVRDYFAKSGIQASLRDVDVTNTGTVKTVQIETSQPVSTLFMGLVGIPELPVRTLAQAVQDARPVEVSLVLDISSSMNSSNRLPRLKTAVRKFADEVVTANPAAPVDFVSVNVVPYSLTVNPGSLSQYFTIAGKHSYRDCAWFETSDYTALGIPTSNTYERYSHMADGSSRYANGVVTLPMCPDHTISPYLSTPQQVTNAVDALSGWDGTGIDIGAKWGLAMLDPSFRPMVDDMITGGTVDANLSGRPYDFGASQKVLIVMSDGENDSQRDLHAGMREGLSPIWRNVSTGDYFVLVRDGRVSLPIGVTIDAESRWYVEKTDQIRRSPDVDNSDTSTDWDYVAAEMIQLTWPEVFNITRTNDLYSRWFEKAREDGYLTAAEARYYRNPLDMNRITETATNQRLKDICALATQSGIDVYAISFDPPSTLARQTLADCASTPDHFFSVQGDQITAAFASIAATINAVRLTQ